MLSTFTTKTSMCVCVCVCERVFTAPQVMKFLDPPLNIEGDMDGLIIYIDRKLAVDYKGN